MKTKICIADEFSRSPAGRYRSDGPFSGERFREDVLLPVLRKHGDSEVEVDLIGVLGFGSSFLEEAFGGLVRYQHFTADQLRKRLKIVSEVKTYERRIWEYIGSARPGEKAK